MPLVLLFIGAVVIIAGLRNTAGDLGHALQQDVPPFLVWGAALGGVGVLGYVPGMRGISRALLALVLVVLVLSNYRALFAGFQSLAGAAPAPSTPAVNPATAYAAAAGGSAAPGAGAITQASVAGTGTGVALPANINAIAAPASISSPFGAFDPNAYLAAYAQPLGAGASYAAPASGSGTAYDLPQAGQGIGFGGLAS